MVLLQEHHLIYPQVKSHVLSEIHPHKFQAVLSHITKKLVKKARVLIILVSMFPLIFTQQNLWIRRLSKFHLKNKATIQTTFEIINDFIELLYFHLFCYLFNSISINKSIETFISFSSKCWRKINISLMSK